MDETGGSPQLEYVRRPPMARGRRAYRWVIAAAIVFAIYQCRGWPTEIWRHFRIAYLQRECLKHPISPGILAYSSSGPAVCSLSPQGAALSAAYPFRAGWTSTQSVSTIYLGELRSSGGSRRFVNLEAGVKWVPGRLADVYFFGTTASKDWHNSVRVGGNEETFNWVTPIQPPFPEIIIYSATLDPSDPSHISFKLRLFNASDTWDGYLKDNGDFVLDRK